VLSLFGQAPTDWQRMGLKGRVKSITETATLEVGYSDVGGFDTRKYFEKEITEFDEKGYMIRRLTLDKKGNVTERILYEYNDSGSRKKAYRYDGKTMLQYVYTYQYENNGLRVLQKIFDAKDSLVGRVLAECDSLGRITHMATFSPADTLSSRTDFQFEDGQLTGWKEQTKKDRYALQYRFVQEEQDAAGNWKKASVQWMRNMHAFQYRYRKIEYY